MWEEMLAYMGVSAPLHIPEFPDIKFPYIPLVANFSKTLGYKESAPPTYHHLHRNGIIKN